MPNIVACSFVVLYCLGIPWRHVFAHYVKQSGDRWGAVAGNPVGVEAR